MLNFFKSFLDFNEKQLQRYRKLVVEINALEDKARDLKDASVRLNSSATQVLRLSLWQSVLSNLR